MLKNTKKRKKTLMWVLFTGLIIFGVLYWLGFVSFFTTNIKGYWQRRSDKEYLQEQENKIDNLIQAYKQDKYGGDTPQKTWKLFVDALKKGDTDLASKYFVVEKQKQMKYEWGVAKKKRFISLFLNDFSKIDSGDYYPDDNTKFRYVVIGTEGKWKGVVQLTYDLILNKQTGKWKIESL